MIYLYKLRKIKLRIEELKKEKPEYLVDFKIMGAEDYPHYTFEDIVNMGHQEFRKKRLLWYAFERDKLSSHNIYKFIKDNPDYKAIIFYGGPHLYRNKLPKNFEKDLINDDMYSFYMAHYLDSLFTRKKVSVFLMQPQLNNEKEFIEECEMRSDTPDFVMYCKPKPFYPLTFSFVKTKTYLKSLYDVLLKHSNIQTKSESILARSLAFRLNNALMRTYIYHEKNVLHKIDSLLLNQRGDLKGILPEFIKIANELLINYDVIKSLDKASETITFNHFPDSLYYNRQLCQILTNIPSLNIQFTQVELYNNQNPSLTQIDRKKY